MRRKRKMLEWQRKYKREREDISYVYFLIEISFVYFSFSEIFSFADDFEKRGIRRKIWEGREVIEWV